ncbi:hypothetical protein WSK_1253 [Novosphingobium sp. Rr 2-17]|uniref:FecR family protein n=1 Tax=Novosphingobium sp. Rr 2-17 TaxID=555793 RepID=UPI0002697B32|nr:FecR domain-containing protein [Novosphingobium sp. Rr 2-17]EIZ80219.1 hypothetical protein WSK_1253 [Novosphingobium sp. Rr 2-17]
MMHPVDSSLRDQATAWHLRLPEGTEADWIEFTEWLEADGRNNAAYEAVCDADLALEPAVQLARRGPAVEPFRSVFPDVPSTARRPRLRWKWPAMAASVALVAGGSWITLGGADQEYTVSTAPGQGRTIALADGSSVVLNGGTQIVLNKADPRSAEIKTGEAQFSIVHDAQRPFAVTVDNQRIVDLGTVFNVRADGRGLQVGVAQGSIRFEDGVTRLRLNAGDTLEANGTQIVQGSKPAADVGSWAKGHLVYRDRPIMEVAADITRAKGIAIELEPEVSQRSFTGVIDLDGDRNDLRKRLELLLHVKVTETADGWSIMG